MAKLKLMLPNPDNDVINEDDQLVISTFGWGMNISNAVIHANPMSNQNVTMLEEVQFLILHKGFSLF
jgi:hypothetical protein